MSQVRITTHARERFLNRVLIANQNLEKSNDMTVADYLRCLWDLGRVVPNKQEKEGVVCETRMNGNFFMVCAVDEENIYTMVTCYNQDGSSKYLRKVKQNKKNRDQLLEQVQKKKVKRKRVAKGLRHGKR